MVHNMIKSGLSGSATSTLYFLIARELDKKMNAKTANIIAYSITIGINFMLQHKIFLKSKLTSTKTGKYATIAFLELATNQFMVTYLLDKKHILIKYIPDKLKQDYPTIMRIFVELSIFLCISYPARAYWIFE